MAIRNADTRFSNGKKERKRRRDARKQVAKRNLLLEALEQRQLLAVDGPQLAGIQPNDGALLALENVGADGRIGSGDDTGTISVRNIAPRDIRIRFDENQQIDPATLASGVRIRAAGPDGRFTEPFAANDPTSDDIVIQPGFLGVGDAPNENQIIVRFAETLPDDLYRIELFGIDDALNGITAIRNINGAALGDTTDATIDNGRNHVIDFSLELGPQIVAVVPQPVTRDSATGALQQQRDRIVIYFNDDDLFTEDNALEEPTQRSAENPNFYRLILTNDTVDNKDDLTFFPKEVRYDAVTDTATLLFGQDIETLADPPPVDAVTVAATNVVGGSLAAGIYNYRIVNADAAGREGPTSSRTVNVNVAGANNAVNLANLTTLPADSTFVSRRIYRSSPGGRAPYVLVGTIDNAGNGGADAAVTSFRDNGSNLGTVLLERSENNTFRLRVGTDEELPAPPLLLEPTITATQSFNGTDVTFIAGDFGKAVRLHFTESPLGAGALPSISVSGHNVNVVLNSDGTTVQDLIDAFAANTAADALVQVVDASGNPANSVIGGGPVSLRLDGLGSSFDTASNLNELAPSWMQGSQQSILISSSIDPQAYIFDLPGGNDDPGHRQIPSEVGDGFEQHINANFGADTTAGVTTILYNFKANYGTNAAGLPLSNLITDEQKQRVREAVELWGKELGIQFLETVDQGLTFATGDVNALDPNDPNVVDLTTPIGAVPRSGDFIVRVDPTFSDGMVIMNSRRTWNDRFGGDWFERAMTGLGFMLGLERANDLPNSNLMSFVPVNDPVLGTNSESIFPGNADIIHGQFLHRPDSNDIDLMRFEIDLGDQDAQDKKTGLFTAESFAERLPTSSQLDTVLSLYREVEVRDENGVVIGFERELIARNDDYYSSDSYISLELGSGVYYIGVTSSGNTEFNPVIEDTGFGGVSQGEYELRLNFRSAVDDELAIADLDRIDESRPGTRFDGDADGTPGGVYNFWFQTQPLNRAINITGDGNSFVDGQTVMIEDAQGRVHDFVFDNNNDVTNTSSQTRIPFAPGASPTSRTAIAQALVNAIASSTLNVTARRVGASVELTGERVTSLSFNTEGVELAGKTIFVDKTSGANLDGTLAKPFDNIARAFAAAAPGDIVRLVGNGGVDGNIATLHDNFAYEIGTGTSGGPPVLDDGTTMNVPRGVTAMIDAGAIFKLRRAHVAVGSTSAGVDRSGSALQVLGTPHLLDNNGRLLRDANGDAVPGNVYFTSWLDETTGRDTFNPTTTPAPGNWGGISLRADVDNAEGRPNLEDEGIFLNYINHADIRYGGGLVRIDTFDQVVNPINMAETRPTVTFNTLTRNADSAMSADPNSFEETNFHSPQFQLITPFTSDYSRIGPDIHGNTLINNSINGLFVRISTLPGAELKTLTVPGRFDDIDIVHLIAENLKIQGIPGEALLEQSRPAVELVTLGPRIGGTIPTGVYNYKLVFVDENGFEGRPSEATTDVTLVAPNQAVQLDGLPPVSGSFLSRRLYRSSPGGVGPYHFVADLDATDSSFTDFGATTSGGILRRDPPSVRNSSVAVTESAPSVPGVNPGTYNYRVVFVDGAGNKTPASDPTESVMVPSPATAGNVMVVNIDNLPIAPAGSTKLLYRSSLGGRTPYVQIAELEADATGYLDDGAAVVAVAPHVDAVGSVTSTTDPSVTAGVLPAGTYNYRLAFFDDAGNRSAVSEPTANFTLSAAGNGTIRLTGLPAASHPFTGRLLYRSQPGGSGPYELITRIADATSMEYEDDGLPDGSTGLGPVVSGVSFATRLTDGSVPAGVLASGTYNYQIVFREIASGLQSPPSRLTSNVTLNNMAGDNGSIRINNLPAAVGPFDGRLIFRSQSDGDGPYDLVAEIDDVSATTSFDDLGIIIGGSYDAPDSSDVALSTSNVDMTIPAGTLATGVYNYRFTFVDVTGAVSPSSVATANVTLTSLDNGSIKLTNLPSATAPDVSRVIYRSAVGGSGPYRVIAQLDAATTTEYIDDGSELSGELNLSSPARSGERLEAGLLGVVRARPDARLKIDAGTIVKLEGARIEATFGSQFIAEGLDGQEIIFTSKLDDRYGTGGTFDTNNDGIAGTDPQAASPSPGDWAGLYIGHLGEISLDHTYIAYGGGDDSKIEGTFRGFNVIELHQAETRITNSVIERNDPGTGGQGPADRFGRGTNKSATIFIRGGQPVIAHNIIRDNAAEAFSFHADSFTGEAVPDGGRSTGAIDRFDQYRDNYGPLIRGNRLENNNAVNGMEIRSDVTLSTESIWDDTDIVHVLFDEIRVPNFHTFGGLRLQSSPTQSLVVKLQGPGATGGAFNSNPYAGAGFTATGSRFEIEDRIGGAIYVLGQPGFPVVVTSLHDDTVGAGLRPDGTLQTDTNNNGIATTAQPGDWRSIRLDQFSHDRNVEIVTELESIDLTAPGLNGTLNTSQVLGDLALSEVGTDDQLRLGFQVHGFLNEVNDIDYYSFNATAGTEIWFDIDRTANNLDTVIDLLDANGTLIAQTNSSYFESIDPDSIFNLESSLPASRVNPLQKLPDRYQPRHASGALKDYYSTNERDAGFRIVLPGAIGERSPYIVRVRSSNLAIDAADSDVRQTVEPGLTSGAYQLQIRMREPDEVPGSTIRYADIRYAQNGIETIGLPKHSPLIGEVAEDELAGFQASNDNPTIDATIPGQRAQHIGNLFNSDRAVQSIAGSLSGAGDVDFYEFEVRYDAINSPATHHAWLTFDLDYADGISRPDTTVVIFDSALRPVLIGRDSNIADDRSAPVVDPANDPSGVFDLSRGSAGALDPFIGTVALPEGNYYVAVTSAGRLPADLVNNPDARLEPINSSIRIAEDRIGSFGGSTAEDPVVPVLLDPRFDGRLVDPNNLWHVSNAHAMVSGHGLNPSFDGSRIGGSAGFVAEIEPNNSIGTAQSLEGINWSLNFDPRIGDGFVNTSTTIPHMTVTGTGDGSFDYYSFFVPQAGSSAIFDIDDGIDGGGPGSVDLDLFLYDPAGNLLNLSGGDALNCGNSPNHSVFDACLRHTFAQPGQYILAVGEFPSFGFPGGLTNPPSNPPDVGDTYTLHFSIENHSAITTVSGGGSTFYFGDETTGDYSTTSGGGALMSNVFSLQGYSAADKPTLYFNYFLDFDADDHFRVYVGPQGQPGTLLASSDSSEVGADISQLVNRAGPGGGGDWLQSRLELDRFAGIDRLQIRFQVDGDGGTGEGLHIDDIIIGFAERGEMVTYTPSTPLQGPTFVTPPGFSSLGRVLNGEYQLEIRPSTQYGKSDISAENALILNDTFDTNDRLTQQLTIVAPSGADISDRHTFDLSDGVNTVRFEYDSNGAITSGNVRVQFSPSDPDYVIARRIRDAINSDSVQGRLNLQAGLSDGTNSGTASRDNKINLFGVDIKDVKVADGNIRRISVQGTPDFDFIPKPTGPLRIGPLLDNANTLRDTILGPGVSATANTDASFVGGIDAATSVFTSAGIFLNGGASIGLDSGIVLTTGDVLEAAGPNDNDNSSGIASGMGDPDLDLLGRTTTDTSSLEFQFDLAAPSDVYFDFVFASEEYNELVNTSNPDAVAVFIDGVNHAIVPGTGLTVSRNTVNGGRPFGTGGSNPHLYNNNDFNDGGRFLRELGYDGFTDVFTAHATSLAAGTHTIKIVIGDVGNMNGDSAIFIGANSLTTVPPVPPATTGIVGIPQTGFGDRNAFRDQGQTLIHSNTISYSADFGIVADAGIRDPDLDPLSGQFGLPFQQPHMGPARNLREVNNIINSGIEGGFAPGASIVNNTLIENDRGGIHVSGNEPPWEIVNAGVGFVCDGDWFRVTSFRTTVEFEFEFTGSHNTACEGSDGWTDGRVPIFIITLNDDGLIPHSQQQIAARIDAAINGSILINNDTTLVAETFLAQPRSIDITTGVFPFESDPPLLANYIDHARSVQTFGGWTLSAAPLVISDSIQPFARVINNTIRGADGIAALFPENPRNEPNDTIFNAVDTGQGRSQSAEVFQASATIGDGVNFPFSPELDVDFYQFQLGIGDEVQIDVDTVGGGGGQRVDTVLRLFDSAGEELLFNDNANPGDPGAGTNDPFIRFTASAAGTYYAAVSGKNNETYSSLSLTARDTTGVVSTGDYNITVNVRSPRRWIVDALPGAGPYTVEAMNGSTAVVSGSGATTGDRAASLAGSVNAAPLPGVSARVFGGNSVVFDARRFVVIEGAVSVTSGPGIRTILNVTNDDELIPETGILLSEESTPTLLNNILSNTLYGVIETQNQLGSPTSMVYGGQLFQHNQEGNVGFGTVGSVGNPHAEGARADFNDFNFQIGNFEPLFVNAQDGNLFPAQLARSLDSSVDSLEDRPQFLQIKGPVGIANSPVLAPRVDASGQVRQDDPKFNPPQGQGSNLFIDRGSLDRSDFVGPTVLLLKPRDNDSLANDLDPSDTVVQVANGIFDSFLLQLVDGFDTADPFPGVGINDDSVIGPTGPEGRLPGSAITIFRDGQFLEETIDYTYRYDSTSNIIHLTPTAGLWQSDSVYVIKVNGRDRFVINAPSGDQISDGDSFRITDDNGIEVTFEYDSGFSLFMPETLVIDIPPIGAGIGGVTDGQRFVVNRQVVDMMTGMLVDAPVVFEFDFNNNVLGSNIAVTFSSGDGRAEIAQAIVDALTSTEAVAAGLILQPKVIENGSRVHVGAQRGIMLDTGLSNLTQPGTTLAIRVPPSGVGGMTGVLDGDVFTVSDGQRSFTFELDGNSMLINPANIPVDITTASTADDVATAIVAALRDSDLDLPNPANLGMGLVYVGGGTATTLVTPALPGGRGLRTTHAARPVLDGEQFTINLDTNFDGTPERSVTFEFDDDTPSDLTNMSNAAIPFTLSDTHNEIAERVAARIRQANVQMDGTTHLGDGLVHLGGMRGHELVTATAPVLAQRGQPDVQATTTLVLPGFLKILVPDIGGAAIGDTQTFVIDDGFQTVTFEFEDPITAPGTGFGNQPVFFLPTDDQATIAQSIATAINGVTPPLVGITPTVMADGVELTGSNGNHMLDVTGTPNLGRAGGRVMDDDFFTISFAGNTFRFEFDDDGNVTPGSNTKAILFNDFSSITDIANRIVSSIASTPELMLSPSHLGNGVIRLFDTSRHQTDITGTPSMTREGIAGGAVQVVFTPSSSFTGEQFARSLIESINNNSDLSGVSATLRGGNTLFVDFLNDANEPADFSGGFASIVGISNYFLRAIQDIPGNPLKANQNTDETQFTILLPDTQLDLGDARATSKPSQYPTLFNENGARHVISDLGLYFGDGVDADPDGQPVPAGLGDDLNVKFDVSGSALTLTGTAPFTIQLPNVASLDATTFRITNNRTGLSRVFEFDRGGNGIAAGSNVAIVYPPTATLPQVGQAMATAIANTPLGLNPEHLGAGVVHIGGREVHLIDVAGTNLRTEGEPVFAIYATDPENLDDGDLILVNDGSDVVPVRFEIDFDPAGSVGVGNRRVDVSTAATDRDVAAAIKAAIDAEGLALTLFDLGDGSLRVVGASSHDLDFGTSGMTFDGHIPAEIQAPSAGLSLQLTPQLVIDVPNIAAGGLLDTQQFTVSDGTNTVVFEFDNSTPPAVTGSNVVRIPFTAVQSPAVVASSIYNAIVSQTAPSGPLTGLNPVDPAGSLVIDLGAGMMHRLNTSASNLTQRIAVADTESFVVNDGTNSVVFEFDFNTPPSLSMGGRTAVSISNGDSANSIANKIVAAVQQAIADGDLSNAAGLQPKNLSRGDIQIGGVGFVDSSGTARLRETGSAGGILDGETFTISLDPNTVFRFEFDGNNQAAPGNITIDYTADSSADDIADEMVRRIEASGFPAGIVHLGSGLIKVNGDDEDGIRFERVFTAGGQVPVVVTVSRDGRLDGWIDFNSDGDWNDQFENVFANVPVFAGENRFMINVPSNAGTGDTFGRFRLSSVGGLTPTGLAIDGEVEDYRIQIVENDPPQVVVPTDPASLPAYNEDVITSIPGVSIIDSDSMTADILVRLQAVNGNILVAPSVPGGVTVANIDPDGADPNCAVTASGVCTVFVRATRTQINTTFAAPGGLRYLSNQDFNGAELITITVDDLGNSGSGGPQQAFATIPITVNPVNDAPQITVPATQMVDEDEILIFPAGGIRITDVDYTRGEVPADTVIQVTMSVNDGILSVKTDVSGGVTLGQISGNDTDTVVITATPVAINTTLSDMNGLTYDSNPDVDIDDLLTIAVDDFGNFGMGGPIVSTASVTIDIRALNDPPVVTAPGAISAFEDTPLPLAGFNVTDVDSGTSNVRVTLQLSNRSDSSGPNGTLTINDLSASGGVSLSQVSSNTSNFVTIIAPIDQISRTLSDPAGWSYTPPLNFAGFTVGQATETLTIEANDFGASGDVAMIGMDTESTVISIIATNDPPVINVSTAVLIPLGPATVPTEDTDVRVFGVSISDPDAGPSTTLNIAAANGILSATSGGGVTVSNNNSPNITLAGPLSSLNTFLATAGILYSPNLDFNGPETLTFTANDGGPPPFAPETGTADLNFVIAAENDPPVIHLPPTQSVQEDTPLQIPSLSIEDVDAGSSAISVELNVNNGSLAIDDTPGVSSSAPAPGSLLLTGTVTAINNALTTLVYTGNLNFNGTEQLSITADDLGNSPGTAATALITNAALTINVQAVNDPPTIDLNALAPNPLAVDEDTNMTITGIAVDDVDLNEPGGTGMLSVTFRVDSGVLSATSFGATVNGSGSNQLVISGTLADVNATLTGGGAGIRYRGNQHFNGTDTLTITANDLGNTPPPGTPTIVSRPITVRPVNDAPEITVELDPQTGQPATRVVLEDNVLDLSTSPIIINDADITNGEGNGLISVELRVQHGIISVATNVNGGLSPANVTANDTATVQIVNARPDQVNATFQALNGLRYLPNQHFNDGLAPANPEALTITVNDLGNGSPGSQMPLVTSETIPISITPVNDGPVLNLPTQALAVEDTPVAIPFPVNAVTDVDVLENVLGELRVTISAANGTIQIRDNVPGVALRPGDFSIGSNGTGTVIFTATPTAINNTLSNATGVTYTPSQDFNGLDTITVNVSDLGNTDINTGTPQAVALTASGSFLVSVSPVNDPPRFTVLPTGPLTVAEDTNLSFSGPNLIAVEDVDSAQVTLTMQVNNGTITVNPTVPNGVRTITNNGGLLVRMTGSPTQINNTLMANGGVVYRGDANYNGPDTLNLTLNDSLQATVQTSISMNVTAVNDRPTIDNPGPINIVEDTLTQIPISVDDVELNEGVIWTVTLQANSGTISVRTDVSGGLMGMIPGNGTGLVTLTGNAAQIQTTLALGVSYQGSLNFAGTDELIIKINDPGMPGAGDDQSVEETFTLNVQGVNDAPVVTLPSLPAVDEDADLFIGGANAISIIDVDAGDSDIRVTMTVGNGTLTVNPNVNGGLTAGDIVGNGSNSVILTGTVSQIGVTLAAANGLTYRGINEFSGTDVLTVTANDLGASGTGGSKIDSKSTVLTINTVNDPPFIENPIADFTVNEDAPNNLIELFPGVFNDPDNASLTLSVAGNSNPSLVNATINGTQLTLRYLPNQNGQAVIQVSASDGTSTVTDTFTVTVNPVNDPPFVADPIDDVVVLKDAPPQLIDLSGVFSDPDFANGDSLTLSYNDFTGNSNRSLVTGSLAGTTLSLTFTPGGSGRADLTVRATDSSGLSAIDTFSVFVNLAPVADNLDVQTDEDVPVDITISAVDGDGTVNLSTVQVVSGSGPANGTVVAIANGVITYLPGPNFFGTDSFQYTVRDNDGFLSNQATVSITINEVADYQNPIINADVNKDGSVSPIDALLLINRINNFGPILPPDPIPPDTPDECWDVDGNGFVEAMDVLLVINAINAQNAGNQQGGGEGEAFAATFPVHSVASAGTSGDDELFVVPDYSLAQPLHPAASMIRARSPVDANRGPAGSPLATKRQPVSQTALTAFAEELERDALDDVLTDIAEDIDALQRSECVQDWVLSGLKPRK